LSKIISMCLQYRSPFNLTAIVVQFRRYPVVREWAKSIRQSGSQQTSGSWTETDLHKWFFNSIYGGQTWH